MTGKMKSALRAILFFAALSSAASCGDSSGWVEEAPGIWKSSFGRPEKVTLTSELDYIPSLAAIGEMGDAQLPFHPDDISFEIVDGKVCVRFPLEKDEHIYGLGLNFKTVDRRGSSLRLHVDHYGGSDNGRTHAPVPFFVSSRGYGAFINSARYIDVYCGTSVRKDSTNPPVVRDRNTDPEWSAQPYSDNLEFLIPAGGVEVVLFAGPSMLDAVRRFNLYHGGGVLPPKWGLGFWQRVPTLYTDADVHEEVRQFFSHGLPLSVIGLEPGWQTCSYPCSYEWDRGRFPDPEKLVSDLAGDGVRLNVWLNPGVAPGSAAGVSVEPYTASHTEWCGLIPDYTMPQARKVIADRWNRELFDIGVSGCKMDENDGYDTWIFPDVATFPSGTGAEQMRQIYGSLMQNLQNTMFRDRNLRTYGLVRAGNAGTSSFPFVIYNDYYDHRDFITALVNSSFIGVLWTPEVRSSSSAEEWLRRMQTTCFSPLAMLNAWADGTKPWSYGEVEGQVADAMSLRMQLLPYIYSVFAEYRFRGIPPVRAMVLEDGFSAADTTVGGTLDSTENPYAIALKRECKDQFMVGESLLVAPLFAGESSRRVVLPRGRWYDFYTGGFAGDGEIVEVTPDSGRIPVFVKDGSIIPMLAPGERLDDGRHKVEARYYGTKAGVVCIYDDDGLTFDYEKGGYARWILKAGIAPDGSLNGSDFFEKGTPEGLWSYTGEIVWHRMTASADE